MSKLTQKMIMFTFMNLLKRKSLDKITVKDILEEAEINRNTFYYYYENIYDLIDKIFIAEVEEFKRQTGEGCTFMEEYERASSFVLNNTEAIRHLYNSKSRDVLFRYLEEATKLFTESFVREYGKKYNLPEEGVTYITSFYTYAIVGKTLHWIGEGMPSENTELIRLISSSFESTVEPMIVDYMKIKNK